MNQIENPKSVVWKEANYSRWTSKDGSRTWISVRTRHCSYKIPGLYRHVDFDEHGQICGVSIADAVQNRKLCFDPRSRRFIKTTHSDRSAPSGIDYWFGFKESLEANDLQLLETRRTASGQVNILRHAFKDWDGRNWSYDFWIDQKTKDLVQVRVPGADIFDPQTDASFKNPPEEKWSAIEALAVVKHDIVFNIEMDHSIFTFEPPDGYSAEFLL